MPEIAELANRIGMGLFYWDGLVVGLVGVAEVAVVAWVDGVVGVVRVDGVVEVDW